MNSFLLKLAREASQEEESPKAEAGGKRVEKVAKAKVDSKAQIEKRAMDKEAAIKLALDEDLLGKVQSTAYVGALNYLGADLNDQYGLNDAQLKIASEGAELGVLSVANIQ
jgi:hypothetical protein